MGKLSKAIREWQTDDEQGYDEAIGLCCQAAERIERLEAALEQVAKDVAPIDADIYRIALEALEDVQETIDA